MLTSACNYVIECLLITFSVTKYKEEEASKDGFHHRHADFPSQRLENKNSDL